MQASARVNGKKFSSFCGRGWLLLFLAVCAVSCCSGCQRSRRQLTGEDASKFALMSKGISNATSLALYEGLPHQTFEHTQLTNELATKKTIRRHEFPFYERPLRVTATDVELFRRLSASADSFAPYLGPKNCGGFHPDYCLAWNEAGNSYELLICLGCHEMKIYAASQELLVDIEREAYYQVNMALQKYRDQRPERQ